MSFGVEFAFVYEEQVLTRFALDPGEYKIGRDPECEIAIDLEGIGLSHAKLTIGERLMLSDLGDESGTFIGRRRLICTEELRPGVDVQLGTAGILRVESWTRPETDQPFHSPPKEPALDQRTAEVAVTENSICIDKDNPDRPVDLSNAETSTPEVIPLDSPDVAPSNGGTELPESRVADTAPTSDSEAEASDPNPSELTEAVAEERTECAPTNGSEAAPDGSLSVTGQTFLEDVPDRAAWESPRIRDRRSARQIKKDRARRRKQEARWLLRTDELTPSTPESSFESPAALSETEAGPAEGPTASFSLQGSASEAPASTENDHRSPGRVTPEEQHESEASHFQTQPPTPPVLLEAPRKKDQMEAEIHRLRRTLVDEMDRRRRAEKWVSEIPAIAVPDEEEEPVKPPERKWYAGKIIPVAVALVITSVCGWMLALKWAGKRADEVRAAHLTVSALRPAADQFVAAAEKLVDAQDWDGARQQLQYALTLAPDRAVWRSRLGDILLAQFQFTDALAAYRAAGAADARLADPWDGIAVCERLIRAREVSGSPSISAMYAVHRTLTRHSRMAEAVKVAGHIPNDPDLQQRTWQLRLHKGGLDAEVQLNESRKLTVRLRGAVQEKLELVRGIPAVAIWMPETDVKDLTPLIGLRLVELDVSRTMVANLEGLRNMPLRHLNLDRSQVEDLLPLRGSPIEELHLSRTPVKLISSLRSMPLRKVDLSHTKVSDLQPLATVPLKELDASNTPVSDLGPLSHLPLNIVRLDDTRVADLTPLRGAPISVLSVARTPITSVEALTQTPLTVLSLSGCSQLRDLRPLAGLKHLQKFILPSKANTKEVQGILPHVRFLE